MTNPLEPKPGFDWRQVRWTGPTARVDDTCSYCGVAIPEDDVPLRLWTQDNHAAVFCAACMETWWGMEPFPEPDEDFFGDLP